MDQVKIGKFIATQRKNANLTQMQLAEKLNITDRAVSKWETGKTLPDSSIMLELCDILGITVNDLLCGEIVTMDNYNKELENNLIEMAKQKEIADKRMLTLEWVVASLSLIILFAPIFVAALMPEESMETWQRFLCLFSGFIPAIIGLSFAMRIEQTAGYYACKHCNHRYVPTFKATTMAPHMGRTRYMRCPQCGQKSWQKKVLAKD